MKTINSWLTSFKDWVAGLFLDERGTASSKRFVGLLCSVTLCASLYFGDSTSPPAAVLVDAVALLAFGCLGLTSVDKFVAAKNTAKTEPSKPADPAI